VLGGGEPRSLAAAAFCASVSTGALDIASQPASAARARAADSASLKRELARVALQQQDQEEAESRAEERQRLEAVAALRNQLSQERDRNEKLRDQLARVQQQHQRLQDEHQQSMLSTKTLELELVALKADLAQERETAARLTRESPTPVSTVRESTAHVDQTPRPMAPYGYWASPSGYRYGGRWWSGGGASAVRRPSPASATTFSDGRISAHGWVWSFSHPESLVFPQKALVASVLTRQTETRLDYAWLFLYFA
jgi:hypothetical protein